MQLRRLELPKPGFEPFYPFIAADWCRKHGVTIRELQERGIRAGVIWQDGEAFMLKDTIRMNLALPHSLLEEALQRLKEKAFV